jgi:dTMP kinase
MHNGFFITIEGIDGIGKSTQIKLLIEELRKQHTVYFTKEPGDAEVGSSLGAGVRELLFKKPGTANLAPGVGDLLFLSDHLQNIYELKKHLAKGEIVVSDRYADSQFAYASHPSKRAPAWAMKLWDEQFGLLPDLTILMVARGPRHLTNPPGPEDISWSLQRANARKGKEAGKQDGKAWNDVHAQQVIQEAYLQALRGKPRTKIVDVWDDNTIECVQDKIRQAVLSAITGEDVPLQPNLPLVVPVEAVSEAA